MNITTGTLSKMLTSPETPVQYTLALGEVNLPLNPLIGKRLAIRFTGKIHCIACQRAISKSYQQGFCFPCTRKLAQCDLCILQPQRCHFHLGTCREPEWGTRNCMIPHWVYLANTSGLKVGITRAHQAQTRWMDQGAIAALPIFEVATRQQSGFVEVAIASEIADKTNWQAMLKGITKEIDLLEARNTLLKKLKKPIDEVKAQFEEGAIRETGVITPYHYTYPVLTFPEKVKAYNLDKTNQIDDTLEGIKGQYLIFNKGVLNIRKFSGYQVAIEIE